MSLVDIFQFKSVYLYTIEDLGLHITEEEGMGGVRGDGETICNNCILPHFLKKLRKGCYLRPGSS